MSVAGDSDPWSVTTSDPPSVAEGVHAQMSRKRPAPPVLTENESVREREILVI